MTYQKSTDTILLNLHNAIEHDTHGNPALRISDNSPLKNDASLLTSFGRLRTSEAKLLGEYRYMYSSGTSFEMNDYTVDGGDIMVDYTIPAAKVRNSIVSTSRSVRQTKQYHPYIPGTNNLAFFSFIAGSPNYSTQRVGLFDDLNGLFFEIDHNNVKSFVVRNNATDTKVILSNWNQYIPTELDFTKAQLMVIDYQWLGVGRVRMGFVIDGEIVYCHYFTHTNALSNAPYMSQPSLPCRWEVFASGGTPTATTALTAICAAVYCEGSITESGFTRSVSTGTTQITVLNSTDGQCLIALRLKNTLVSKPNRSLARLLSYTLTANNIMRYQVVRLNDSSKLSSPTWNQVPGYSWCEYSTNTAMVSGWATDNAYNVISDGFVASANGQSTGMINSHIENKTASIFQNYDSTGSQVFAIIGYKIGTNATTSASFQWIETK